MKKIDFEELTPAQRNEFHRRVKTLNKKWETEHKKPLSSSVLEKHFGEASVDIMKYSPDQERDEGGRFAGEGGGGASSSGAEKAKTQSHFYEVSNGKTKEPFFFRRDAQSYVTQNPGSKVSARPIAEADKKALTRMQLNLGPIASHEWNSAKDESHVAENKVAMQRLGQLYDRGDQ